MKTRLLSISWIASSMLVAGCSSAPVVEHADIAAASHNGIAMEAAQERSFAAARQETFHATQSAMEKAGYVINTSDYGTGVLEGDTRVIKIDRLLLAPVTKGRTARAFVESTSDRRTVVRIDFVARTATPDRPHSGGLSVEEVRASDSIAYEKVFADIEKTLFPEKL
jgi:hypothetical protein